MTKNKEENMQKLPEKEFNVTMDHGGRAHATKLVNTSNH